MYINFYVNYFWIINETDAPLPLSRSRSNVDFPIERYADTTLCNAFKFNSLYDFSSRIFSNACAIAVLNSDSTSLIDLEMKFRIKMPLAFSCSIILLQ